MKQTSVNWLIEELGEFFPHGLGGIELLVKQAREMHKEEIIDACDYGIKLYINDPITSEDYYNDTYKQQDNEK